MVSDQDLVRFGQVVRSIKRNFLRDDVKALFHGAMRFLILSQKSSVKLLRSEEDLDVLVVLVRFGQVVRSI